MHMMSSHVASKRLVGANRTDNWNAYTLDEAQLVLRGQDRVASESITPYLVDAIIQFGSTISPYVSQPGGYISTVHYRCRYAPGRNHPQRPPHGNSRATDDAFTVPEMTTQANDARLMPGGRKLLTYRRKLWA
jgi:hypothetical protein